MFDPHAIIPTFFPSQYFLNGPKRAASEVAQAGSTIKPR